MIFGGLWFKVSDVNCSSQARQNKYRSQIWGLIIVYMTLASCSSSQNAFFAQINALSSQGYTWQKLERCRPAKPDALSIPVIGSDGRELVCYKLMPPQNGTDASVAASTPAITSSTTIPATSFPTRPTPDTPQEKNYGASGIIWNFSNF